MTLFNFKLIILLFVSSVMSQEKKKPEEDQKRTAKIKRTTTALPESTTTGEIISTNTNPSTTSPFTITTTIVTSPALASPTSIPKTSTTTTSTTTTTTTTTITTTTTTTTEIPTTTNSPDQCLQQGTVCLIGGRGQTLSGDIKIGGRPICDDNWGIEEANVICRMLGHYRARVFTRDSHFGVMDTYYAMDNVKCQGTESSITQCFHSTRDDCESGEAAGVVCDSRDFTDIMNSTCYDVDIAYQLGASIDHFTDVESVSDCQVHCQDTPDCNYFTYYIDIQRCYTKASNSPSAKEGAVSGPRNCSEEVPKKEDECWDRAVGYMYGDYLDYFNTLDVEACQEKCQEFSGCTHFSFYVSNNECYMKTGDGNRKANPEVVSGPKYCPGQEIEERSTTVDPCSADGVVCLKGGEGNYSGNVYLGNGNLAKPVCDDSWDQEDGLVVCRELGFFGVKQITKESVFGKVHSSFIMDNVGCDGTETKLMDCHHSKQDDCGGMEGAGVICDQRTKEEIEEEKVLMASCFEEGVSYHYGEYLDFDVVTSPMSCQQHCLNHQDCNFFTYYPFNHKCYRKEGSDKKSVEGAVSGPRNCSQSPLTPRPDSDDNIVTLKGGSTLQEGNVFVGGRPVCDDEWMLVNADVVCKELGYIGALAMTTQSRFGEVEDNFVMDQVRCDGTEDKLVDCIHSDTDDCSAGEAAGVICDIRSQEEADDAEDKCFEIGIGYNPGDWIDYDITSSALDCQTHCRGHTECTTFTFYTDSHKCYRKTGKDVATPRNEAVSGPRLCQGQNNSSPLPPKDCSVPGTVCLSNSTIASEGNVFVGGRPICDDSWDLKDGAVVCRELGYNGVRKVTVQSKFGNISSPVQGRVNYIMDDVNCRGSELSLTSCPHSSAHNCNGGELAGVMCDTRNVTGIPAACKQQSDSLCLLPLGDNGTSLPVGNIFVGGRPVCDDGWTLKEAIVVCKQLGFRTALQAVKESHFGPVPTDFVATEINCRMGVDRRLSDCANQTVAKCGAEEGAGVICSDVGQESGSGSVSGSLGTVMGVLVFLVLVMVGVGVMWWRRDDIKRVFIDKRTTVRGESRGGLLNFDHLKDPET